MSASSTTAAQGGTKAINYRTAHPDLYAAMHALQEAADRTGLERGMLEMVKLRASQINGCAFCVNLHAAAAREAGESDARLHLVSAWRHARSFSERERAALRWCERVTRLEQALPSGDALQQLRAHFSDEEIVALTWTVAAINAWNRMAVPLGQLGGPPAPRGAAR